MTIKLLCVVGARPNFMKVAPIYKTLKQNSTAIEPVLVHTGQHYDKSMDAQFFEQLNIPKPEINLEVGSGTHAIQTAKIMQGFDGVLDDFDGSDARVLVVGDVNSTLACALVTAKRGKPLVHVEAGMRSLDRGMPEEINRILTDQLSDLLFTTERAAEANLTKENIPKEKIHFVGNVMIDTLREYQQYAVPSSETLEQNNLDAFGQYGLVTLHRPSNVDNPQVFNRVVSALAEVSEKLPLVFPVHPRTRQRIESLDKGALDLSKIHLIPPVSYLEMLGLMREASLVLTDSGGVQEETTALGVPCLTLRDNTERPVTVSQGSNTIVGTQKENIIKHAFTALENREDGKKIPELWDGQSANRIADKLEQCWL